mmetsp:Transcript_12765/g.50976  ORF Transcript_12765/g.50976 Transcript_12765/m.50976 type:complete len:281 (+) Transcript_12765:41-883(+)
MASAVGKFDTAVFLRLLTTHVLGRSVQHHENIESTQELVKENASTFADGSLVVADVQTKGKGRGGNSWTSPAGCLMFTFVCSVGQGAQLPFLQYLVSLALVKGIRGMQKGMAELPVAMKWPNDIYVHGRESQTQKIGGILCQSEYVDGKFRVVTGVGINVANDEPSTCINQLIRQYSPEAAEVSREGVLAAFCNEFEPMLATFEELGFDPFRASYHAHWMHSRQAVTVKSDGVEEEVDICGLAKNGYLQAVSRKGDLLELHPDGNSLDFFKGLVSKKVQI